MTAEVQRPFRIGISGSYGGFNMGDEAILSSMITQIEAQVPAEITVFSRCPEDTLRRHRVSRAVPVRELSRQDSMTELECLDLFVLGGGGLLYDKDASRYLREVRLAKDLGIPVMVYAISAGPLTHGSAREAVRLALEEVDVITVRDRTGHKLLEDVGVTRGIEVTADPALLLEPADVSAEQLRVEGLSLERPVVAVSVREPGPAAPEIDVRHYHQLLADAADFMVHRFEADVAFVPMERVRNDMQHCHAVIAQMHCADRATVLRRDYGATELLGLFRHFQFAVGMRLHFLIFAALQGVPFVALPYASKVKGLLQDLEMEMPQLRDVNAGRLIAAIDQSWDRRQEVREHILKRLPHLQERASANNTRLVSLLLDRADSHHARTTAPGNA